MFNCKTNSVEEILKHYEKIFYKYQYESTTTDRLSVAETTEGKKIKSIIELLRLLLKNNIYYLSDTNDILLNRLRSSL